MDNNHKNFSNCRPGTPHNSPKTLEIQKTELDTNWRIFLTAEYFRGIGKYSFNDDINGRFVVRKIDRDPTIEADYIWVDFYLESPTQVEEGDVYVNSSDNHIYCYLNGSWKQLDN